VTYRETIDYLYTIRLFGVKLGLENVQHLLELLGNPQRRLRFIHIAGTNGKGSVAAMLASIYQQAGLKTGLYTSPHLVSFCERIQVNRQPIAESDVVRLVERLRPVMTAIEQSGKPHPTFFEVVTSLALLYFAEQTAEIVIWETGMGGRLDATNVVTPLVSVITNISWDHQSYLGRTLEAIAREKAGIIKPGVPVVTATSELEAVEVIEATCLERNAPLTRIGRDVHVRQVSEDLRGQSLELAGTQQHYGSLHLPLIGGHQAINAATAVAVVEAAVSAANRTPQPPETVATTTVSIEHVREGLAHTLWPGRFQLLERLRPPVVLDGAHNIAGVVALKATLGRHFAHARLILILGILADKNYQIMCAELAQLADVLLAVQVQNERAADPAELARVCRGVNPSAQIETCPDVVRAYHRARELTANDQDVLIVITGSLFLVGEALHRLPLGWTQCSDAAELTLQ
jgi:dihydrofolate synthase/folylpolyglutamate synthase